MPLPHSKRPEDKTLPLAHFSTYTKLVRFKKLALWLPVEIASKNLPWGYVVNPIDSKEAIPEEKALKCFLKVEQYLLTHSYQIVADWLTSCGYKISGWGLQQMLRERPFWPELKLPLEERMKL